MNDGRIIARRMTWGRIRKGKPKMRWKAGVGEGLRGIEVVKGKEKAKDRIAWTK